MKNQDQILLERAYYKLYEQEQPAQQLDAKVEQQLQKSIEQLVQAVTANPQDETLINTLKQLSQTEDPQKQAQILKAAESTAKQSEQQVQEQVSLPQFHRTKAALGALKDPNTSYGDEKRKSQVASLRKIIGRSLAELDRDLKTLRYDPAKHPEVDKVLTDVRNTVGGEGIEKVDTKFDRAVHGAGKFATGAVRNAAMFAAISGSLGAAGVANPYAAKAISGAATSVLRDLSKGQLNKGSVGRAVLGAGIGTAIQGASELIGGAGGAAGDVGAAGDPDIPDVTPVPDSAVPDGTPWTPDGVDQGYDYSQTAAGQADAAADAAREELKQASADFAAARDAAGNIDQASNPEEYAAAREELKQAAADLAASREEAEQAAQAYADSPAPSERIQAAERDAARATPEPDADKPQPRRRNRAMFGGRKIGSLR